MSVKWKRIVGKMEKNDLYDGREVVVKGMRSVNERELLVTWKRSGCIMKENCW